MNEENLITIKKLGVIIGRSKSYINIRLRLSDAPKPVVKGKPTQILGADYQFTGSTSNLYNREELVSFFEKVMASEVKKKPVKAEVKQEVKTTLQMSREFLSKKIAHVK